MLQKTLNHGQIRQTKAEIYPADGVKQAGKGKKRQNKGNEPFAFGKKYCIEIA